MNIYKFSANNIRGNEVSLQDYAGKVVLIVNTASKCGFTPQYEDLQKLYDRYKEMGLTILAFPCDQFMNQEFQDSEAIQTFCTINYGVTFPIFEKINVNGVQSHPLFHYLKESAPFKGLDLSNSSNKLLDAMIKEKFPDYAVGNAIRWNFTKFLIDRKGNVIDRFEPTFDPIDIEPFIEKLL